MGRAFSGGLQGTIPHAEEAGQSMEEHGASDFMSLPGNTVTTKIPNLGVREVRAEWLRRISTRRLPTEGPSEATETKATGLASQYRLCEDSTDRFHCNSFHL